MFLYVIRIHKLTCDVGQQDGEEDHRSKKGGDHDVQRIPAARGHLEVEETTHVKMRIVKSEDASHVQGFVE